MAAIFSTSEGTYYKWKRENRPIINLLDKYFTKEELEEFLETGEISSFSKVYYPIVLLLEKLEQKQREQDEVIQSLKRELEKLQRPQYDKAGYPKPSGNPRK
jgi:phosphoglycerate-specific signal transduction histidine kinase